MDDMYQTLLINGNFVVRYGRYWDEYEDMFSPGLAFVENMIKKGSFKGKTYIECMLSEKDVPIIKHDSELTVSMEYTVYPINDFYTKCLEKTYLEYMGYDDFKLNNDYDNIICIVDDNPFYSHSKRNFYSSTILIVNSQKSYIIDFVYKEDKINFNVEELSDKVKKLELK